MGFSRVLNFTGRWVLACDFCGGNPSVKIRCPYGYCQAWATCKQCRKEKKHLTSSVGVVDESGKQVFETRKLHAHCKMRMDESAEKEKRFREGGLILPIGSGKSHAADSVKNLWHVLGEWYYTSCDVSGRTWHTKEELKEFDNMGHALYFVSDEEEERIKNKSPYGFMLDAGNGENAVPLENIL